MMKSPPVTKPYFSTDPVKEKLFLGLCWVITLLFAFILTVFWDKTRDLAFILYLQQFRTTFVDIVFRAFTFLGDDQFFMIFLSIILWCVSKPLGFWTAFILLTSGTYSGLIKDLTVMERPALAGITHPDNHAFPSGHTLTAVTVWGYMAIRVKKSAFWVWAVVAMFMIGSSRLVLGYHFLGDVLAGVALAIPFLLLFAWLNRLLVEQHWTETFTTPILLSLSLAAPLAISFLLPGSDPPKLMGYLAGASFGYLVEKDKLQSVVTTTFFKQVIKSILGLAVLFSIIMGLGPLLPSKVPILGFIRYGLGGLWVTYLAPLLFVKIKLSKSAINIE